MNPAGARLQLGVSAGLLLALVVPTSAPAAVRVVPAVAVPGAAVQISAPGLAKAGLRVTIAGRRATVLSVTRGRARVVVPKVTAGRAAVVLRRGSRVSRGRLTVRAAFKGRIGVVVDAKAAVKRSIGPGGGTLTAKRSGTTFTLTIPAGGLAAATDITLTPVARLTGLPLSGAAAAVRFAPEGLRFAMPATLVVSGAPAGKLIGFAATGSGASFGVLRAKRLGRRAELAIDHFSTSGVATGDPADFAAAVGPIVNALGTLTEGQIQTLVNLVGAWEALFPGFCQTQPVCQQAIDKARASLDTIVTGRCATLKTLPSRPGVQEMIRLSAYYQALGLADNPDAMACARELMEVLISEAVSAVKTGDPLAQSGKELEISAAAFPGADLDGGGSITHFEWLVLIGTDAAFFGMFDLQQTATAAIGTGFDRIRTQNLDLCETDRFAGRLRLERGSKYAQRIGDVPRQDEFARAIDACKIDVTVSPLNPAVNTGATQQFTASVTSNLDTSVTWSASAGTIDANGLYTAPAQPGSYVITATSKANPKRSGTTLVHIGCNNPSCQADVVVNLRDSGLTSNAAANVPEVLNDPKAKSFTGLGSWNDSVSSSANQTNPMSGASASGTGSASQNSNVTTSTAGLSLSATGNASATASASGASATGAGLGDSELDVEFVLGKEHHYTFSPGVTVPVKGVGTVTLTGPSGTVAAGSGTLPAGSYTLSVNLEAEASTADGVLSSSGSFSVALDVTA